MQGLLKMSKLIDRLNEFLGRWVVWLVLAAVLLSAGNAIVRKVFNNSSNAMLEMQWYFFSAVFLLPMAAIFVYLSWPVFIRTYTHGEISTNAGGLLIWPARALVPVGFTLLLLQGISELIKRIAFLTGAGPDPVPRHDAHAAEKELAEEIRRLAEEKK